MFLPKVFNSFVATYSSPMRINVDELQQLFCVENPKYAHLHYNQKHHAISQLLRSTDQHCLAGASEQMGPPVEQNIR